MKAPSMLPAADVQSFTISASTGFSFNTSYSVIAIKMGKLVHIEFAVSGTMTKGTWVTVCTLPTELWPQITTVGIPIQTSQNASGQHAQLRITDAGNVDVYQYGSTNASWANINTTYYQ